MSHTARAPLTALVAVVACLLACLTAATGSAHASPARHRPADAARHVVAYYQTQYDNGAYVSPSPLGGIATDIDLAAFHLDSDGTVHLNDDPPSAAKFDRMWSDLAALQKSGVRVEAMLGGAAQGTYANLHDDFTTYYGLLRDTLRTYHLDGVDLDIEEPFSLADTEHLIRQLRTDFGSSFVIAMAPVASDLSGGSTYSGGFDYRTLEQDVGSDISWYNAQFYCGWGDLSGTSDYDAVVSAGFAASRVVAGTVTNSANCSGYVDPSTLDSTLRSLVSEHSDFAGVAGWEYFNAQGSGGPQSWYQGVRDAMN
ncbi:glycosyl hydrolase family 18 protein [Streptantibioticus parmotrematis]|uniref:glycosyl hydrolase family 18 protein n=1 Tax=Streptantibioticus parmotrematis TaxID=2873249 RepID=UPI0033F9BF1F